jgi:hypothetical protein
LTVVFDTCATAAANGLGNRALTVGSTFLTFALPADWGGPGAVPRRCAALGVVFAAQMHSQHDQPYDYKKGQHPERDFSTFFHFATQVLMRSRKKFTFTTFFLFQF